MVAIFEKHTAYAVAVHDKRSLDDVDFVVEQPVPYLHDALSYSIPYSIGAVYFVI